MLIVNGCGGDNIPEPGSELRDFEFAWWSADKLYAHFELKGIDWDEVYQKGFCLVRNRQEVMISMLSYSIF
ncbi:hypothetical protein IIA28_19380 [candidate division KSB1 bacterium]|nr:hypothetical protein [candidate division KSB1 bacterium]